MENFPATRADALSAWHRFLPEVASYAALRNHVVPGHPHVSRLSPAISRRLLAEDELIRDTLAHFPFAAAEKFVQEIHWRGYWKAWLELRPQVWLRYRENLARLRSEAPDSLLRRAAEIADGAGDVAVMNHFAHELTSTGYLHNHARMWFASYWIHIERLPWELGADFFARHLLDFDAASNTLSWRWVAGLQTRGKTYLVRRSNLEKFLAPALLADPSGLDRLEDPRPAPIPEENPYLLRPDPAAALLAAAPFQLPSGPFALLLHEEDLLVDGPDGLPPDLPSPACLLALPPRPDASPAVQEFSRRSLSDALARAAALFPSAEVIPNFPAHPATLPPLLVSSRAPCGPVADHLRSLLPGLTLRSWPRPGLSATLDSARAGYFAYWEKISRHHGWPLRPR